MAFSKLSWLTRTRGADLTDAEFRVLVTLATYTDKQGANAFPGNARLADDCHMQARSVRRILRRLVEKGWIVETFHGGNEVGKGKANEYRLEVIHKGDPGVPKGDRPVPLKGDPGVPGKGDSAVPPSGHIHQGIASGHYPSFRRLATGAAPSAAPKTTAGWDAMQGNYELLEEWLEAQGALDVGGNYDAALGMWERGMHPLAILNTLDKQAS